MPCYNQSQASYPDTNGNGFSNTQGNGCVDALGLLPVRQLGLDDLSDSSGAALWYAVSQETLANALTIKNSSLASSLTLDTFPVSAIVIAPGQAINGQNRAALNVQDFLEGVNADANRTDYTSGVSATQNDQLLAVTQETLWGLVQDRANAAAANLLNTYLASCGEYPWAATYGGSADSVLNQQSGLLPLGTALPFDWGSVCGGSTAPAVNSWLATHWQDQLLYRMCTSADGNCVNVINGAAAAGVIVAPGIPLAAQARPSANPSDYFELENNDGDDTEFRHERRFDHDSNFNDTVTNLP